MIRILMKWFAVANIALVLSGCGFTPLYGVREGGTATHAELEQIQVLEIDLGKILEDFGENGRHQNG